MSNDAAAAAAALCRCMMPWDCIALFAQQRMRMIKKCMKEHNMWVYRIKWQHQRQRYTDNTSTIKETWFINLWMKKKQTEASAAATRGRREKIRFENNVCSRKCVWVCVYRKRQALPLKVDRDINGKKTRFSHVNFKWIAAKISHSCSWYGRRKNTLKMQRKRLVWFSHYTYTFIRNEFYMFDWIVNLIAELILCGNCAPSSLLFRWYGCFFFFSCTLSFVAEFLYVYYVQLMKRRLVFLSPFSPVCCI